MANNLAFKAARQRIRNNTRCNHGQILTRYAYGDGGQMQTEYTGPVRQPLVQPALTVTYDADNRILTFNGQAAACDPDANTTSGPLKSSAQVLSFARAECLALGPSFSAYATTTANVGCFNY